jgi:hypothetical protein
MCLELTREQQRRLEVRVFGIRVPNYLDAANQISLTEGHDKTRADVGIEIGPNFKSISNWLRAWRIARSSIHEQGKRGISAFSIGIFANFGSDKEIDGSGICGVWLREYSPVLALPASLRETDIDRFRRLEAEPVVAGDAIDSDVPEHSPARAIGIDRSDAESDKPGLLKIGGSESHRRDIGRDVLILSRGGGPGSSTWHDQQCQN